MNILFVNKVSPELGGGAEARILEIGKRLTKRGCNVNVLCATTKPGLPRSKNVDGIDIFFIKTCPEFILKNDALGFHIPRTLFYLLPLNKLRAMVAQSKVDVIIEDVSPTLNPSVSQIAKHYNIPLVYSIHEVFRSLSSWIHFYGIYGLWGYIFEKKIRERKINYQRIITVVEWVRSSLANDIPNHIIDVIPNGVDLNRFKPLKKLGSETINLLNVGRFAPHKGHTYLLKAVKILLSSRSDFILHLVGSGPLLPKMRRTAYELGIGEHVIFHGYVPDNELLELYSKSDVFILPSIYEGFPVVIPEAMAMGLPIVSTDIPAIKGILNQDNAIIVKPANPFSLAQGVKRLLEDAELRDKLSEKVRREALEKFDWERITDTYFSCLSSLVE